MRRREGSLKQRHYGPIQKKIDKNTMQCELDFFKREHDCVSSRCNDAKIKAKTSCNAHLRDVSNTCKQDIQFADKMGFLRTQSTLRENCNQSKKRCISQITKFPLQKAQKL